MDVARLVKQRMNYTDMYTHGNDDQGVQFTVGTEKKDGTFEQLIKLKFDGKAFLQSRIKKQPEFKLIFEMVVKALTLSGSHLQAVITRLPKLKVESFSLHLLVFDDKKSEK